MTITVLETEILKSFFAHACSYMGGKKVADLRGDNCPWMTVEEIQGPFSFETARAVCGSLAAKGLIGTDRKDMFLTDKGLDTLEALV